MKRIDKVMVGLAISVIAMGAIMWGSIGFGIVQAKDKAEETKEQRRSAAETTLTEEEKELQEEIAEIYHVESQQKIAGELEEKKANHKYTVKDMLIVHNPFGTNTQALYVYFHTDEASAVSYKIHVADKTIEDFSQDVYQEQIYQTEHEFQVIGLIPGTANKITFTMRQKNGETYTKEIMYNMGSISGDAKVKLETDVKDVGVEQENGMYAVKGNSDTSIDYLYLYDSQGVLRSEVPLLGDSAGRLMFGDQVMYYGICADKTAAVSPIGQVLQIFDTAGYEWKQDLTNLQI